MPKTNFINNASGSIGYDLDFVDNTFLVSREEFLDDYTNISSALVNSELWLWGRNDYGQLGDNTITHRSSPVQTVAGGTNWKQVSCGAYHTAAIKKDGTLWLWGRNNNGQLGDNTATPKSSPVQTIAGGTNWKQVACGDDFTAVIKKDGTLWLWGNNDTGQLGDNTTTNRSSPVQTVAGGTDWIQVACGGSHVITLAVYNRLGLDQGGRMWVWGNGGNGQLGNNSISSKSSPVLTNMTGGNWKEVAAGAFHTAAVVNDGTLWTWGYNALGQLGDNTRNNRSNPGLTVCNINEWRKISCGETFSAAIRDDGTLWAWGYNSVGSLGDNTSSNRSSPVQTVAGGTTWYKVSCARSNGGHMGAIKIDGTLWLWGRNDFGQLGDNTITHRSSPVQTVAGATNWKQVSCGTYHTAAIRDDISF